MDHYLCDILDFKQKETTLKLFNNGLTEVLRDRVNLLESMYKLLCEFDNFNEVGDWEPGFMSLDQGNGVYFIDDVKKYGSCDIVILCLSIDACRRVLHKLKEKFLYNGSNNREYKFKWGNGYDMTVTFTTCDWLYDGEHGRNVLGNYVNNIKLI